MNSNDPTENTGEPSNERIPEFIEGLMAQRDEALAEVERLRDALAAMEGAWTACNDDRDALITSIEGNR